MSRVQGSASPAARGSLGFTGLVYLHYTDFISSVKKTMFTRGGSVPFMSQGACSYRWPERLSVFRAGLAWILESGVVQ